MIRVEAAGTGIVNVHCPPDRPYVTGGGGFDEAAYAGRHPGIPADGAIFASIPGTPPGWAVASVNGQDPITAYALCAR